jgi:hypothetical protein
VGELDEKYVRAMFGTAEMLGVSLSAERVAGYWSVLGHFGTTRIVAALRVTARTARFPRFPLPSELIEIITGVEGDDELAAVAAWVALLEALATPEAYQMTKEDARVKAGVTACGGLYVMRTGSDGESMTWKQRKFVTAYRGQARAEGRRFSELGATSVGQIVKEISEKGFALDNSEQERYISGAEGSPGADIR